MTFLPCLVSVGLPVYNEAAHLPGVIESWLAQDFHDFEILISDNASTDGTAEICRQFAAQDARIRLFEQPLNIGPFRNHLEVFERARGEYFLWAGGHDHPHPSFLSKTAAALQADSSLALCAVRSEFRDEEDICWRTTKGGLNLRGLPPAQRFAAMLNHLTGGGTANLFYSLYRRNVLARLMPFQRHIGNDVVLLTGMAALGALIQLDDALYYRYVPQKRGSGKERIARHIAMLFGAGSLEPAARLPQLGYLFGFLQLIERLSAPGTEKQAMEETVAAEARRIQSALRAEFDSFVEAEQAAWAAMPAPRGYRALKTLEALQRAALFGLQTEASARLLRLCEQASRGAYGSLAPRQSHPTWKFWSTGRK